MSDINIYIHTYTYTYTHTHIFPPFIEKVSRRKENVMIGNVFCCALTQKEIYFSVNLNYKSFNLPPVLAFCYHLLC